MQSSPRSREVPAPLTDQALRRILLTRANTTGGWGYYAGKASRLEPTCWALLALGSEAPPGAPVAPHAAFLAHTQRPTGWLVEDPSWPINIGFNALAAFTWLSRSDLASDEQRQRLLAALAASKGVRAAQNDTTSQDNSLQGWPWIDATFSWVEPTAWGVLALKQARRAGLAPAGADQRISEAERLLVDRVCRDGGWNYGNASVLHQDLRPYVPTTALALLALQGRRDDPAVVRSLAYLEAHWRDERSATALGLALVCLDVYGRPVADVEAQLAEHLPDAVSFGNMHGLALALLALSKKERVDVFRV